MVEVDLLSVAEVPSNSQCNLLLSLAQPSKMTFSVVVAPQVTTEPLPVISKVTGEINHHQIKTCHRTNKIQWGTFRASRAISNPAIEIEDP